MPATPYARILASPGVPDAAKRRLTARYERLDPVRLERAVAGLQERLYEFVSLKEPVSRRDVQAPPVWTTSMMSQRMWRSTTSLREATGHATWDAGGRGLQRPADCSRHRNPAGARPSRKRLRIPLWAGSTRRHPRVSARTSRPVQVCPLLLEQQPPEHLFGFRPLRLSLNRFRLSSPVQIRIFIVRTHALGVLCDRTFAGAETRS